MLEYGSTLMPPVEDSAKLMENRADNYWCWNVPITEPQTTICGCAITMLFVAVKGRTFNNETPATFRKEYPILMKPVYSPTQPLYLELGTIILRLFTSYDWTVPQIVSWLRTL